MLQRQDLNLRSLRYERSEIATSPRCDNRLAVT